MEQNELQIKQNCPNIKHSLHPQYDTNTCRVMIDVHYHRLEARLCEKEDTCETEN